MNSPEIDVLCACAYWLGRGESVTLVTVTKTWGSSPRPPGSLLAMRGDGFIVGSVSGGCIEDDLIDRLRSGGEPLAKPQIVTYGVSADEARRFGLPCGGTIELVLEPLINATWVKELIDRTQARMLTRRCVSIASGAVELMNGTAGDTLSFDGQQLVSVHGSQWRLLIIGGGQLANLLASMAMAVDFHVLVCDPREDYVAEGQLPGVTLLRDMPDDTVVAIRPDARCAIVALSHDPKLDDMALLEALKSEAFYVGAIGSRVNNAKRRERLRLFDLTDDQINRLHGPVGLDIGSKSPPEIAVSILAHMIAVKNGVGSPSNWHDGSALD